MGERAKVILNEYSAKNLLMRDTLDLDKFYTADLKLFVEVARKEIERLQEENLLLKASEPMSKLAEDYGYKAETERLNNIIKEVREYKNQLLFDLNRGKEFEKWEEILNPIDEILDKEVN